MGFDLMRLTRSILRAQYIAPLLTLLLCVPLVQAQDVTPTLAVPTPVFDAVGARFETNNYTPLIGEPFELRLVVEVPAEASVTMPAIPPDWPPFMVQEIGEVSVTNYGATSLYEMPMTVILWLPGDYLTAELSVSYQMPDGSAPISLRVAPGTFTVPSVLDEADLNLRPLKATIDLPYVSPLLGLGALAGIIAIIGVVFWWLKRNAGGSSGRWRLTASRELNPGEAALAQLNRIVTEEIPALIAYPMVADCLRTYIERRYELPAHDMSTDELFDLIDKQMLLSEKQRIGLLQILDWADLVKFAGLEPASASTKRLVNVSIGWLQASEAMFARQEALERKIAEQSGAQTDRLPMVQAPRNGRSDE